MKRVVFILLFLCFFRVSASAQKAFSSLSAGLEVSTTGVGVELALPVVTDHLVLKGGFMAPSIAIPFSTGLPATELNRSIEQANATLAAAGISESIQGRFSSVPLDMSAKFNFSAARILLEYYPFKKSSFHIVAGAYIGSGNTNFLSAEVSTGESFASEYNSIMAEIESISSRYPEAGVEIEDPALDFNFAGTTYRLAGENGSYSLAANLVIPKVRPYVGLGFGRSIPDGRVGFQFELGAWYHGTPSIASDNALATYNPDAFSLGIDETLFSKIVVYPQVSLRLIIKLI